MSGKFKDLILILPVKKTAGNSWSWARVYPPLFWRAWSRAECLFNLSAAKQGVKPISKSPYARFEEKIFSQWFSVSAQSLKELKIVESYRSSFFPGVENHLCVRQSNYPYFFEFFCIILVSIYLKVERISITKCRKLNDTSESKTTRRT